MKDPLLLLAVDVLPALDTVLAAVDDDAVLEAELAFDAVLEWDEDAALEGLPPSPPVPVTGGSGPSTNSHPQGAARSAPPKRVSVAAKRSFERSTLRPTHKLAGVRTMRYPISITDNFLLEPVLHTFGVKPESTYTDLEADHLEISMGRWFHEKVPLAEIAVIAPSDWPWWGGLGVKLAHHGIGVVGSTEGIVNIKLKKPQKMHAIAVVEVEQLWVSLVDRDGFLKALGEATKLPISPHVPF
jgi:hypothetical protein